tara:strand:+ start:1110 stop:2120 length:1011 start_codon:yes stop_codon:yes gene_type:complete
MIKSPYSSKKKFAKLKKFKKTFNLKLYKYLYLLRSVEEYIQKVYPNQKMRTPTHLGIGQEAISVGVCLNLKKKDSIFCHHRSHLPYLAMDGSVMKLFSELMGNKNGTSGGKGGSVHLTSYKNGYKGSTAILGQSIGLAVGAGLANKLKKNNNISVSFFGNASLEEGSAYESINFSSLMNIPTLFVYENNFYSSETNCTTGYMKTVDYKKIIGALGVAYKKVDGNDISQTLLETKKAVEFIRKNKKPYFIEFTTYRWLEHCGPFYDYELGRNYRKEKEINYWKKYCPLKNYKSFLEEQGLSNKIQLIEKKVDDFINKSYIKSYNSAKPKFNEIYKNI